MHKKVQALLDEHDKPTHLKRDDTLRSLQPLLKLGAKKQQQIAEYRGLITDAETDPSLPDVLRDRLNTISASLDAADRIVTEFLRIGREFASMPAQLDRVMGQATLELQRFEGKQKEK